MVTYRLEFSNRTLTNSDLLEAPKYTLCINSGEDFCLGNAAAAEVSLKTKALTSGSIGQQFDLFRAEGTNSPRHIGYFTITEATKDKDAVYNIKAYDNMIKFDVDLSAWVNSLTFPISLVTFARGVAQQCGVSINTTGLPNSTLQIPAFTAGRITGRQLLKYIAQATGRFARIADQTLIFGNYNVSTKVLTNSDYSEATLEDYVTPVITGLWIGKEDGDVGVTVGTSTNLYKIYNNPLLYGSDLTSAATTILNEINTLSYTAGTVTLRDLGALSIGDIIHIDSKVFAVMELSWDSRGVTLKGVGLAQRSELQTTQEAIDATIGKTNVFKRTLDATISTITDMDGRLTDVVQDVNGLSVTVVGPSKIAGEATYAIPSDCTGPLYGFTRNTTDNWYYATNTSIDSSYAICRISFRTAEDAVTIPVSVYQKSEPMYDYGFIGLLDTALDHTYASAAHDTNVWKSWEGMDDDTETFDLYVATAGWHFIEIKYYKDLNTSVEDEVFKFIFNWPAQLTSRLTIDKGSAGIAAANISFDGLVTFTNLAENDGATIINGNNITTGSISADRISGGTLSGSEINIGEGNFTVDYTGAINTLGGAIAANTINVGESFMEQEEVISPTFTASTKVNTPELVVAGSSIVGEALGAVSTPYYFKITSFSASVPGGKTWTFVLTCFSDPERVIQAAVPQDCTITLHTVFKANNPLQPLQPATEVTSLKYSFLTGQMSATKSYTIRSTAPGTWMFDYLASTTEVDRNLMVGVSAQGVVTKASVLPYSNNTYSLGASDFKWNKIYAQTGTIDTSDAREKKDIEELPESYSILFDNLKPVRYKFIENTSDRYHTGFIAQDVEEAIVDSGLTTQDFACLVHSEKDVYGLRYDEIIALLVKEVQTLKQEVKRLKDGSMD